MTLKPVSITSLLYNSIFLLLFFPGLKAQGNDIPLFLIDQVKESFDLTSHLYYVEDIESTLQVEDLQGLLNELQPYSQGIELNSDYTYWALCRLQVEPSINLSINDWKLFVGEADFFGVYILDEQFKILSHKEGGSMLAQEKKELKYGNHERRVTVDIPSGKELYLVIRYSRINHQDIHFNVQLQKFDYYQSWKYVTESRRDWFFLGFIFTMLVFNFMYFLLTRSDVFLYHGLFIMGVFIFTLDYFGVTPDIWIIRDHPDLIQLVDYLALALIDICYFQFVRKYLNLAETSPHWDKWFKWILLLKVVFFIFITCFHYLTWNEPMADRILSAFLAVGFAFAILFVTVIYRSKSINHYFIIAGTLILFLAVIVNANSIMKGMGLSTFYTELGLALEIILFSMAMAYRLKVLRDEEIRAKNVLEIDALKNKFFTNISHEFRTPLTIINGMTEVAREKIKSLDTSSLYQSVQKIRYQSDKVLTLVNQILGLTKLETKSLRLDLRQINVVVWLRQVVTGFVEFARQRDVDLHFNTNLEEFLMDLDVTQLKTVISNLLTNAIKFSDPGGVVEVTCSELWKESQEGIEISVKDNGRGIHEKHIDKIFDRFYQVDSMEGSGEMGFGVGLSMCKELMEYMKGTILVKSQIEVGSTFTLWLPVTRMARLGRVDTDETDENETESLIFPYSVADEELPIILIVDDNPEILDFLETLLKNDFTVEKAHNGFEGVEKAKNNMPDIIISDIMMPMKDGYELCNELKNNLKTDHIPIILLTAKVEKEDRLVGWERGADAYLTKPFDKKELFLQINKLQLLRHKLQEKYSKFSFVEDNSKIKKESTFIKNIHKLLEENLSNSEFSVEEMAKKVFMSRMQLHRKIKALSNMSASHYIRSFRLHKGKLLLKDLNNSIGDVSYDVGFQSPNYFSRCFQKEFGITPSEYKESIQ